MSWLEELFDRFLKKWFNIDNNPQYLTGKGRQ
jgi:hypothetical protein